MSLCRRHRRRRVAVRDVGDDPDTLRLDDGEDRVRTARRGRADELADVVVPASHDAVDRRPDPTGLHVHPGSLDFDVGEMETLLHLGDLDEGHLEPGLGTRERGPHDGTREPWRPTRSPRRRGPGPVPPRRSDSGGCPSSPARQSVHTGASESSRSPRFAIAAWEDSHSARAVFTTESATFTPAFVVLIRARACWRSARAFACSRPGPGESISARTSPRRTLEPMSTASRARCPATSETTSTDSAGSTVADSVNVDDRGSVRSWDPTRSVPRSPELPRGRRLGLRRSWRHHC